MKNDKNIYKLAQAHVDNMDFAAMEDAALISLIEHLKGMTEEEFIDEWELVIGGKISPI